MRVSLKFVLFVISFTLLTAAMGRVWAAPATVSIDPAETGELPADGSFTVNVVIADVTNLYGWQINVTFNPNILSVSKVSEGPFLKSVNKTAFPKPMIDNSKGNLLASSSFLPPYPASGASGGGTLANITFTVKSGGGSDLHFDKTLTYLRTVQGETVVPIADLVTHDGTYGGGGSKTVDVGGLPVELIAVVAVVAVIAVAGSVFFLMRRRRKAESTAE